MYCEVMGKCKRSTAIRIFSVTTAITWVLLVFNGKIWTTENYSDENDNWNEKLMQVSAVDIKFVINEPNHCDITDEKSAAVFLLVLMHSATGNFEQRERQRQSCLKVSEVVGKRIESLFLLGETGDQAINSRITWESERYHDVVTGSFHDSYRNLTLKTLMGFKWASEFCPLSSYVMKADDDALINFKNLITFLLTAPGSNFIAGHKFDKNRPVRDPTNKWFISEKEYPGLFYPPYLNGMAYVMSGDLAGNLCRISSTVTLFPLEDVYVGMLLKKLQIEANSSPCFIYKNEFDENSCSFLTSCAVQLKRDPETVLDKCNALKEKATIECLDVICYNRFAMIRDKFYPQCNSIK